MEKAAIFGKRLVALAGAEAAGKDIIEVVNMEISDSSMFLIGIDIKRDDFDFFISNLPRSKVEATIFMPEFQRMAAEAFGKEGYLVALYKKEGSIKSLVEDSKRDIEDRDLLEILKIIGE